MSWQPKILGQFLLEKDFSSEALVTRDGRFTYRDLKDKAEHFAGSQIKVGDILTMTGDIRGAAESYWRAVEISEKAASANAALPHFATTGAETPDSSRNSTSSPPRVNGTKAGRGSTTLSPN